MTERIKTGLIIVGIYILFLLYLLFASDRFEKIDNNCSNEINNIAYKLNNN